jgi:hypothetical protein
MQKMNDKAITAIEVMELGKDSSAKTITDKENAPENTNELDRTTSSAATWLITVALALSFFLTGLVSEEPSA